MRKDRESVIPEAKFPYDLSLAPERVLIQTFGTEVRELAGWLGVRNEGQGVMKDAHISSLDNQVENGVTVFPPK